MADVEVHVGGRSYKLSCRDGEEDQLRALARLVDQKASDITKSIGEMTEARTLLLSALLIADELNDVRGAAAVARNESPADNAPDPAYAVAIERIAERVERLAMRLEGSAE
jgi:cell division protein ZapA